MQGGSSGADNTESVVERIRSLQAASKSLKPGKPDATTTQLIQEVLSIFNNCAAIYDVTLASLKCLDDVLNISPQSATIIRLEGGLKTIPKVVKAYLLDAVLIVVAMRVLYKATAASSVTQQLLSKEKGFGALLLNVASHHMKDTAVVGPVFETMQLVTRYAKGAYQLAIEALLIVSRELLVNLLGSWNLFGVVLKVLKNIAKHEAARMSLLRSGEVIKLLLGVARLLSRLPEQRKLLKRASRALWLFGSHVLVPLPDLEGLWPLPAKDSAHLNLMSAMEADAARHMELFPEDYAGQISIDPLPSCPAMTLRQARTPGSAPLTSRELSELAMGSCGRMSEAFHAYGNSLDSDMMAHDLRRLMYPDALLNRLVYINVPAAVGSVDPGLPPGTADSALSAGSGFTAASSSSSQQQQLSQQLGGMSLQDSGAFDEVLLAAAKHNAVMMAQMEPPKASQPLLPSAFPKAPSRGGTKGHTGGQGRASGASTSQQVPPLSFESSYEGGNLRAAVQVYENEYDLFLASDLNDRSEGGNLCQWFQFAVSNVRPGVQYKFNLVNFRKKQSLFSSGKRPLVCLARPAAEAAAAAAASSSSSCSSKASSSISSSSSSSRSFPSLQRPPTASSAIHPSNTTSSYTHPNLWVRAGHNISYYPSPYRGRSPTSVVDPGWKKPKKVPAKKGGKQAGGKGAASKADPGSLPEVGPGLYCCTFTLQFEQPGTYYVASCYPYSYTCLQEHLTELQGRLIEKAQAATSRLEQSQSQLPASGPDGQRMNPPAVVPNMVRSLLAYTLSGHSCEAVTITDFNSPQDVILQRECIVLSARVHPGETCASWIMQGIIDFLTSDNPVAHTLRNSFVFKIVPMLNPDGVINGNYRCSLAGCDLNRVWDRPNKWVHPTIYHAKKMLQYIAAAGRLALYIDIHGHSNKEDVFFYGCEPNLLAIAANNKEVRPSPPRATNSGNQGECDSSMGSWSNSAGSQASGFGVTGSAAPLHSQQSSLPPADTGKTGLTARVAARLRVRMLPYLTARTSQDYNFNKCNFRIRKCKLTAARVVVNRELGVAGSYTMEASLGGQSSSQTHFTIRDYLMLGHNLCRAIAELAEVDDAALLEEMLAKVQLPAYTSGLQA